MLQAEIAMFGTVRMIRALCPNCNRKAFVIDNEFACCDTRVELTLGDADCRRESLGAPRRRNPTSSEKRAILAFQDNKCFYCDRTFGDCIRYKNKVKILTENWDHLVPWKYSQNNNLDNFVAACQICNNLKKANVFDRAEDAREYVREELRKRGLL